MTKVLADGHKFGATEKRVHKEPGMLAWQVKAALSYVSHGWQSSRSWQFSSGRVSISAVADGSQGSGKSLVRVRLPLAANRPVHDLVVRRVRVRFRMRDV